MQLQCFLELGHHRHSLSVSQIGQQCCSILAYFICTFTLTEWIFYVKFHSNSYMLTEMGLTDSVILVIQAHFYNIISWSLMVWCFHLKHFVAPTNFIQILMFQSIVLFIKSSETSLHNSHFKFSTLRFSGSDKSALYLNWTHQQEISCTCFTESISTLMLILQTRHCIVQT